MKKVVTLLSVEKGTPEVIANMVNVYYMPILY